MNDSEYMQQALTLARKGVGFVSPNPLVGAVVVNDGRVVGQGYHAAVGKDHAEVMALDDAGPAARGATLYVTLEPCNHFGRTPPCTQKILAAGIQRVVVAMADPNPRVAGGGMALLKQRGIEVTVGEGRDQALKLNEAFVKHTAFGRPFVTLKCAATLDGRIATRTGDSRWVSGEASRSHVHELRHAVDAILVGRGTVQADNPRLTTRREEGSGRDPLRIVLDTRFCISDQAHIFNPDSEAPTMVVTGPSVPAEKRERMLASGVRVIAMDLSDGLIDLAALMERLGDLGITSLLVEGGSRVIASALRQGIVDKVLMFYAPKILGGDDGVPICRGPGPDLMREAIGLRDLTVRRFDEDVMIAGYVQKPLSPTVEGRTPTSGIESRP